ncbi:MAG: lysozyme inhibitor LprI family protein [Solirubrobacteraceae bacterium]
MCAKYSAVLAVLAGAAALVTAPGAAAARTQGVTLSAPAVHESFSPLPCTGTPASRTTQEQEGCAEQLVSRSDRQINALNVKIFGRLPKATAKRRFIAGHNAWVEYRKNYRTSFSDVFQGGSQAAVLFAECLATSTNSTCRT